MLLFHTLNLCTTTACERLEMRQELMEEKVRKAAALERERTREKIAQERERQREVYERLQAKKAVEEKQMRQQQKEMDQRFKENEDNVRRKKEQEKAERVGRQREEKEKAKRLAEFKQQTVGLCTSRMQLTPPAWFQPLNRYQVISWFRSLLSNGSACTATRRTPSSTRSRRPSCARRT
jgi:hypothetical protein